MKAYELDSESLARAAALASMAETIDMRLVESMVAAWLKEDLNQATKVVAALAVIADQFKARKEGHAAFNRLKSKKVPIPPEIEKLEREYQRSRKQKMRRVERQMVDEFGAVYIDGGS